MGSRYRSFSVFKMKIFFVLIVVVCLASDFCDAAKKAKKKSGKEKKEKNGEDYGLIGELLGDPSLIKALIPKNLGELFDIAEEIVPGMKDLQAPIEKSWKLLHPVLKDLPDVVEKLTPTLIEIRKALQGDGDISDEHLPNGGRLWSRTEDLLPRKRLTTSLRLP